MNFRRYLSPEAICLDLQTKVEPEGDLPDDWDPDHPRNLSRIREDVLLEITELFENAGAVVSPRRLHRDLILREKKAVTALGDGNAVPHVRTLQVKKFSMAFGRSREGVPYFAPDDEPVHLFFAMAAPPYDDKTYLKIYSSLAKSLLTPGVFEEFMAIEDPSEVLLILNQVG